MNKLQYIIVFVSLFSLLFLKTGFAMQLEMADTTISLDQKALTDSTVSTDSLKSDSTKKKSDIDAVVVTSATDSITYDIKGKKMYVFGKSNLKYKKTELNSAAIALDFQSNEIFAKGAPDSTGKKMVNTPVLSEAGEIYEGNTIRYNFKSQRGNISLARNEADGTVYTGEKVRKIDKEIYFIKNGTYTTCDAETSHFHFYAKEMKVIMREQIIAKWIWLYIGGVPLPIPLPFGAFPNQSGRRSGLIMPAYGNNYRYGQNLSHLGYFWAISDYMDINALGDFYFKGGYSFSSLFRYAKRYKLNGTISGGYSNRHSGEEGDYGYYASNEWNLNVSHNQVFNPTTRLDAHLSFMSSNYYKDVSTDYNETLNRTITSNASFYKTWDETGNSLSLSYSRTQYLENGNINEVLPSASFNMAQFYPFKKKNSDSENQKWYELMNVSYSASLQNNREKESGNLTSHAGIQHSLSTGFSPKIGYFNISPSVSYEELWYNKQTQKENYIVRDSLGNLKDSLVSREVKKLGFVRTFNFSLSASTKIYGILQPDALGVQALRHTITPRISYSFQPDFSKDFWGYYGKYKKSTGEVVKYDKYENEVYGGAGAYEQQSLGFSVDNVFEIKTKKDPTDTTSQSRKIQLLNLSGSLNYNFTAPKNKLSDLSVYFRTQAGDWVSLNGSAVYSFYEYRNGAVTNRYLWNKDKSLVRLRNFRFEISTSLSAEKFKGSEKKSAKATEDEDMTRTGQQKMYQGLYKDEEPDYSIPWDLSLGLNYYKNNEATSNDKTAGISASFNFSLTKSLKLYFNGSYDLIEKKMAAPQIRIFKELHCWEMNFEWRPIGYYRGYRFEIRVKAPQLQDIKLERERRYY